MHLRSGHHHQTQLTQRPDKWHLEKMCRDDIVQMDANNSLIEQQVYREFQILVQLNHDRDLESLAIPIFRPAPFCDKELAP